MISPVFGENATQFLSRWRLIPDHENHRLKAADTAANWHAHQRRKGKHEEPYINHLLEVAMLVAEATEGKRPDLVVAALLHDAIEDQEVPRSMIVASFGRTSRRWWRS